MGNFFKNATGFAKFLMLAALILGLWFGLKFLQKKGVIHPSSSTTSASSGSAPSASDGDADLVVAYNTFPGMEGLLLMNGGMKPNTSSRLYTEYGIKLQIKQMDVVQDTREGLKQGSLDLVYCTTDALPIEMSDNSALLSLGVKEIMKVNESRGADAIVVCKGINSVADLKGKRIAYAVGTASNTLLINVLDAAGLSINDITPYKVADGVEAASAFKNGQCDAAVVWAPDDEDCAASIGGAKILISTSTATQIIADGLLVTETNLNAKRELITKLCKAWMVGNGLMNNDTASRSIANHLFAQGFNFPEDVAAKSAHKIRFSTIDDNKAFFDFDPTYTGVTGAKMYGRMSIKYTEANLAKAPAPWPLVSDGSVIQSLISDQSFVNDPNQASEGQVVFTAPTKADVTVKANSNKVVSITFATASYTLDDQAKRIVDREVTSLAQGFANARIRVEGNTDNVGNEASNKALSKKRAQAVVDYLVDEYQFDKNKFIIVGNGSTNPVSGNDTEDGRAANRRTDFQFIW